MRPMRHLLPAIVVVGLAAGAAAGVPPETAARLERALAIFDKGFVGSFTLTVTTVVEKPNGKDRQEGLHVIATTRRPDGSSETTLVKAIENGKDVTEREQAKEKADRARATPTPSRTPAAGDEKREKGGKQASAELTLPVGDDARLYRLGEPVEEGDLVVVPYEPTPEHRGDDGIAKGRLAWSRDSLDPAWLEAELLALPTGASRLVMRFEFARSGDVLYPKVTTTSGAGGILWIKRKFEARMEISDLVPGPSAASGAH